MTAEVTPVAPRSSRQVALADVQTTTLSAQRARVTRSAIGDLDSDTAEIRGSTIDRVQAAHCEIGSSLVQRSSANVGEIERSLVGVASADDMSVRLGATLASKCNSLSVQRGIVGASAVTGPVHVDGAAGLVLAPRVSLRGSALVVVSPRVEGSFTTLLGSRQALLAGAAAGLVVFALQRLFRR